MQNIIRNATSVDLPEILRIDRQVMGAHVDRSDMMIQAIQESGYHVLVTGLELVAFAIFTRESFRCMDFLNLLVVHPAHRRLGHATSLLLDFQKNAITPICWTSTNSSNSGMIGLLRHLDWVDSGYAEELDLNDPDLFFSFDRKNVLVAVEE